MNRTTREQIGRDVPRTLPELALYTGHNTSHAQVPRSDTQMLSTVLTVYAAFDPSVGYTQGMNLIAGLLLLYMDEEQTLRHLALLMVRRNLRPLFKPGFPGLQRSYFVWNRSELPKPQPSFRVPARAPQTL